MSDIDPAEHGKRLTRLTDIFADIVSQAETQSLTRCPYRNAADRCTAKFACQCQRKPAVDGLLKCTHDGTLDYRSAWESDPEEYVKLSETLKAARQSGEAEDAPNVATVRFGDAQCPATAGRTVFDHADVLDARVPTSCGRVGSCHECIVEIRRGMDALSPRSKAETFLQGNYRLACQATLDKAHLPIEFSLLRRSPRILTDHKRRDVRVDSVVTRQGDNVCYDGEVIDRYRGRILGLAMDLGTTTVAAELVDLETGRGRLTTSFENPQRFGGSDILNRISYDSGEFEGELHRAIINTLNTEIQDICRNLEISRHEIYEIFVVGNSTMRDLFFGLDVQSIGQRPYKSLTENEYLAGQRGSTALTESARKLHILANKNARVVGAPLIASHVGADIAADLVAIDMDSQRDIVMLVDVGTNTEVVLGNKDRLLAASCPAGPAFEGGLVQFGMPGCDGAVESIRWSDGTFNCQTIGNVEPQGICGSGLIDLLAELRRHGLMTPKGVFADKARQFTILPDQGITFSREDASHLAQAKAANYCGQMLLMRKLGIPPDEISRLYLAGGFANYVDPVAAIEIGFLAPVPVERIEKAGNAALQGAREMLLSHRKRDSVERLIARVEHVELETMPDFFDAFVEGCQFNPMEQF